MSEQEKAKIIADILQSLKMCATLINKPFDAGGTFFSLCFKSDSELLKIKKLCK